MENQEKSQTKLPWEEAALAASSHSDLFNRRAQAKTKEEQNALAKFEHRAFAREAVTDNPALAVPLVAAIPAYQASKALGLENSRSDASVEQMAEGFKGVGEGLQAAVKAPWEQAKEMAQGFVKTAQEAVQSVKKLLPWEQAAESATAPPVKQRKPIQQPTQDHHFETVFSKLVKAESQGQHTTKSGKLTESPVGAKGITQIMGHTGKDPGYGVKPLQNNSEEEYIRMGRDYLQAMLKKFNGSYEKALAAYNAGPGNVDKAIAKGGENWKDHLPKKSETLPYIEKILGKK